MTFFKKLKYFLERPLILYKRHKFCKSNPNAFKSFYMAEIENFKYGAERYYNNKFIYLSDELYKKFLKFINSRKACVNNFNTFNELINHSMDKVHIENTGFFTGQYIIRYKNSTNIICQVIKENIIIKRNEVIVFSSKYFKYDIYDKDKFYSELLNSITRIKAHQRKSNNQNGWDQWNYRNYNRYEDFFRESFYGHNQYRRWSHEKAYNEQYKRWDNGNTSYEPKVELTSEQKKLKKLEEVYVRYTDQLNREKSEGKDTFQTENEMAVVKKKIDKLKNKINEK
jgi:hypothetical protein